MDFSDLTTIGFIYPATIFRHSIGIRFRLIASGIDIAVHVGNIPDHDLGHDKSVGPEHTGRSSHSFCDFFQRIEIDLSYISITLAQVFEFIPIEDIVGDEMSLVMRQAENMLDRGNRDVRIYRSIIMSDDIFLFHPVLSVRRCQGHGNVDIRNLQYGILVSFHRSKYTALEIQCQYEIRTSEWRSGERTERRP